MDRGGHLFSLPVTNMNLVVFSWLSWGFYFSQGCAEVGA